MYLITTLMPSNSNTGGPEVGAMSNTGASSSAAGEANNHPPTARHHPLYHRSHAYPALINHVLPRELIIRIFSYLDIVALCRCAQVCRRYDP